jgi:hypothetical protein
MEELWHSPAMDQWRALMPAACVICAAYPVCHGGCRAIQELDPDHRDPLRHLPLDSFTPSVETRELPASGRPRFMASLRKESFGYALLGQGQVILIRPEARPVVEACTGKWTFAQLAARFGEAGLDLLGELWESGMLELV